jgi:hypothetical protein
MPKSVDAVAAKKIAINCDFSFTFVSFLRGADSTILQRTMKLCACSVVGDGKLNLCVKLDRIVD